MHHPELTLAVVLALATMVTPSALAHPEPAGLHTIECPAELPENAVAVPYPPTGWIPAVRTKLRLRSAEPMVGPPSAKGYLKPSFSKSSGNGGVDKWTELDGTVEGGKWIACSYGGNNEIILARQIDDKTSECSVAYRKEKGGVYVLTIACRW
jgi:hypothetical protein